jgi:putative FmdB family regulatory protein
VPIYEYECRGCHHEFELLVLRDTVPACPSCQGQDLERLPTGFAVSSSELAQARVEKARAAFKASKNRKDQKIAEAEHVREHIAESQERALNAKK